MFATDGNTPSPPDIRRGTTADIRYYRGVTSVSKSLNAPSSQLNTTKLFSFMSAINLDRTKISKGSLPVKLPQIQNCPMLKGNWEIKLDEINSGYPLSLKRSLLLSDQSSLDLQIWVASDSTESALDKYMSLGSTHMSTSPIFEQGPSSLGESSGQFIAKDYVSYIWITQNIVFDLRVTGLSHAGVLEIAQWLHDQILEEKEKVKGSELPVIEAVEISHDEVRVGDTLSVTVKCSKDMEVSFGGNHKGLYISYEKEYALSFKAATPSDNHLIIYVVDPKTLISTKRDIFINVSST